MNPSSISLLLRWVLCMGVVPTQGLPLRAQAARPAPSPTAYPGAELERTPSPPHPGERLYGLWSGTAQAGAESTEVQLTVSAGGASLSLPRVGVLGWPARSATFEGDGVRLEFPSDSGMQRITLLLRNGRMEGTWSDPRFPEEASLVMARTGSAPDPQEHRVLIPSAAGHLGASLLLPEGTGPFPGVVLLHGSGPQPRDASRFHARELALRGVAALIYDKRGVGASTGPAKGNAFNDLAADAITAAKYLRAQRAISRVGFYGHSQGGWIAPLAASRWADTAFVITSSGPSVSPARESQWDVVRRMRIAGVKESQVERARAAIMQWYAALKDQRWGAFNRTMEALRAEPWFPQSGLVAFAENPGAEDAATYLLDHDYDPLPALHATRAPILWILSRDDESIDAMETTSLLEGAISAGRDVRIKLYEGYDHTLRKLGLRGAPLRWPQPPEDLLDVQVNFILASLKPTGVRPKAIRTGASSPRSSP